MPCFVLPLMHISEKLTEDAWMGFHLCSIDTCDCFIRSRGIGHAAGSTATRPMKDAATWIAGCGEWWTAPHFQASTRRMGLAGERREPCMLMATVRARRAWSLMLMKRERGQTLGCRSRRRLPGMASSQRVREQNRWCERPDHLSLVPKGHAATEG